MGSIFIHMNEMTATMLTEMDAVQLVQLKVDGIEYQEVQVFDTKHLGLGSTLQR